MCNQKFGPQTQSSSPLGNHNVLKCLGSESSYCDYCYFYRVDNRNYYGCADKRNDVCEQVRSAGHQCQQCYSNDCNRQWVPIRKPDPAPTRHVPPSEPSYDALESGSAKYSISISLTAAALSLIFH
uniref:Uncharacterized protein n=1 Tax=Acrobeloides nanus TaxID=290746 RepID=A0A914E2R5_9BILA